MSFKSLKHYLDEQGVEYTVIHHEPTATAPETAAAVNVPKDNWAKAVIVKIDGKLAMVLESARVEVNLELLKKHAGTEKVEIAHERDFKKQFPDCEIGAMSPFGNLYGLDVFVDSRLTKEEEITFNAESHSEAIKLAYKDYERLVKPIVL